jgi:hypothetical protein
LTGGQRQCGEKGEDQFGLHVGTPWIK